jgi:hypothetical protein
VGEVVPARRRKALPPANVRSVMAIGEKVVHFQNKGSNLGTVKLQIENYLKNDGFSVQSSPSGAQGSVIQARKGGFLREVVDADRALTIMVSGNPDDFTVRIGIGKWLKHLAVATLETLLLSDLFLVVDVAESGWNFEIEDKLAKQVKAFVG